LDEALRALDEKQPRRDSEASLKLQIASWDLGTNLTTDIVSNTFVQNAVDLRSMFLNRADPHARNGE
jgi:hypothetical protein